MAVAVALAVWPSQRHQMVRFNYLLVAKLELFVYIIQKPARELAQPLEPEGRLQALEPEGRLLLVGFFFSSPCVYTVGCMYVHVCARESIGVLAIKKHTTRIVVRPVSTPVHVYKPLNSI